MFTKRGEEDEVGTGTVERSCPSCGRSLKLEQRFCGSCGAPGPQPALTYPVSCGRPRRSAAWVYYAALAVLGVVLTVAAGTPGLLVPAALCGAYSIYIFRGGRIVIWFW
jgi:hypothetical protein